MIGQISVAAASASVGTDLFEGEIWQQSPVPRVLARVGLAGSAAALDTKVSVFIGTVKVAEMYNSATGAVLINEHMIPLGEAVPPNEKIHMYVDDAPDTNPINAIVEILE